MARRATGRRGRDARAQAFPAPALDGPGSVAGSLGVLAAIVFVHELGHFTAAKARGVRVSKFALGFGPKVLQREWDGVELSLRAVPLGGFVGFPDDDPDSPYPPDDAFLLRNRPLGDRALVISAGVMANIMFAFTIFLSQASTIGHQEQVPKDGLYVPDVFQESSASSAGIRSGDTILSLDESPLPRGQDGVRRLIDTVRSRPHQPVHLTLQHQGAPSPEDVTLTPEAGADGSGRARMTLQPNYDTLRAKATGPVDAVAMAFRDTYGMGASVLQGIWSVFANLAKNSSQMSSPVAIVATGAEMAQQDASSLFQFAAAINVRSWIPPFFFFGFALLSVVA